MSSEWPIFAHSTAWIKEIGWGYPLISIQGTVHCFEQKPWFDYVKQHVKPRYYNMCTLAIDLGQHIQGVKVARSSQYEYKIVGFP